MKVIIKQKIYVVNYTPYKSEERHRKMIKDNLFKCWRNFRYIPRYEKIYSHSETICEMDVEYPLMDIGDKIKINEDFITIKNKFYETFDTLVLITDENKVIENENTYKSREDVINNYGNKDTEPYFVHYEDDFGRRVEDINIQNDIVVTKNEKKFGFFNSEKLQNYFKRNKN